MTLNNTNSKASIFNAIVAERRSVRFFDTEHDFDHEAVTRSLEQAVLAPSSSNLQFWEFYRVIDADKRAELGGYCFGQKAATTASELVVVVVRPDKWASRVKHMLDYLKSKQKGPAKKGAFDYYEKTIPALYQNYGKPCASWIKRAINNLKNGSKVAYREGSHTDIRIIAHKSVALAAQNLMMAIKAIGYDTCPMEGMDSMRIKRMLNLPAKAEISMVIGIGKGLAQGVYGERYRLPQNEVVFTV